MRGRATATNTKGRGTPRKGSGAGVTWLCMGAKGPGTLGGIRGDGEAWAHAAWRPSFVVWRGHGRVSVYFRRNTVRTLRHTLTSTQADFVRSSGAEATETHDIVSSPQQRCFVVERGFAGVMGMPQWQLRGARWRVRDGGEGQG